MWHSRSHSPTKEATLRQVRQLFSENTTETKRAHRSKESPHCPFCPVVADNWTKCLKFEQHKSKKQGSKQSRSRQRSKIYSSIPSAWLESQQRDVSERELTTTISSNFKKTTKEIDQNSKNLSQTAVLIRIATGRP